MWIDDVDFDGTNISGVLVNNPNWLTSVSEGQLVSVPFNQIQDWIMEYNGKAYGAFTVNAMRRSMPRIERESHDDAWGLDFR